MNTTTLHFLSVAQGGPLSSSTPLPWPTLRRRRPRRSLVRYPAPPTAFAF